MAYTANSNRATSVGWVNSPRGERMRIIRLGDRLIVFPDLADKIPAESRRYRSWEELLKDWPDAQRASGP